MPICAQFERCITLKQNSVAIICEGIAYKTCAEMKKGLKGNGKTTSLSRVTQYKNVEGEEVFFS